MTSTNSTLNIAFIGCVAFSEKALLSVLSLKSKGVNVCGVVTKSESVINDDHCDLSSIALHHKIPTLDYTKNPTELASFLKSVKPDIIYCFGWSHLLPAHILTIAPRGVIGFHPSLLPENRGRHPIIWALVLGLTETASSFFQMDEGADSGPIISQKKINISTIDTAQTLYSNIIECALEQIPEFTLQYKHNDIVAIPQDMSKASYWRKRHQLDGVIDWRMTAKSIYNLIRALTIPYCGAEFLHHKKKYKVWSAEVYQGELLPSCIPGTIIQKINDSLIITCGDNSAILLNNIAYINHFTVGEQL